MNTIKRIAHLLPLIMIWNCVYTVPEHRMGIQPGMPLEVFEKHHKATRTLDVKLPTGESVHVLVHENQRREKGVSNFLVSAINKEIVYYGDLYEYKRHDDFFIRSIGEAIEGQDSSFLEGPKRLIPTPRFTKLLRKKIYGDTGSGINQPSSGNTARLNRLSLGMPVQDAIAAMQTVPLKDAQILYDADSGERSIRLLIYEQFFFSLDVPIVLIIEEDQLSYFAYIEELNRSMDPKYNVAGFAAARMVAELTIERFKSSVN